MRASRSEGRRAVPSFQAAREAATWRAIRDHAGRLGRISPERIRDEFSRMLVHPRRFVQHQVDLGRRAVHADGPHRGQEIVFQFAIGDQAQEGALGVGSALAYTPGAFASTDELIALASAAGEFDG